MYMLRHQMGHWYIYILCILSFNSLIKVYICLTWIVAEQSTLCWFKITTVKVSIIVLLFFIWSLCFIIADFSPGMAIFLLVPIIGSSCFNGDDVLFIWLTFFCYIFVVCFCCVFFYCISWYNVVLIVFPYCEALFLYLLFLFCSCLSCHSSQKSYQHNVLIGQYSTYITIISLGVKYQLHADWFHYQKVILIF